MTTLLTVTETATKLAISTHMVHVLNKQRLLEAHYPKGLRGGKYFDQEEVEALLEVREQGKAGFTARLPQLALRAIVSAKRTEKNLEELMTYLGLTGEALGTEKEEIIHFYDQVRELVQSKEVEDDELAFRWAKKLLAVTEEYLELARAYTQAEEPWKQLLAASATLLKRARSERVRAYVQHARRNLRHVAYFYERGANGIRRANRIFPDERYTGRLLQRIFPV